MPTRQPVTRKLPPGRHPKCTNQVQKNAARPEVGPVVGHN